MRDQGNFQTFERIAKKRVGSYMYCWVKGPQFSPTGIKKGPKYPFSIKKGPKFGINSRVTRDNFRHLNG